MQLWLKDNGETVGVSDNIDSEAPTMSLDEMREYCRENGGTIMQREDGPASVLERYGEDGEQLELDHRR